MQVMSKRKKRTGGVYKSESFTGSPAQGIKSDPGQVWRVLPWPRGCPCPVPQNTPTLSGPLLTAGGPTS